MTTQEPDLYWHAKAAQAGMARADALLADDLAHGRPPVDPSRHAMQAMQDLLAEAMQQAHEAVDAVAVKVVEQPQPAPSLPSDEERFKLRTLARRFENCNPLDTCEALHLFGWLSATAGIVELPEGATASERVERTLAALELREQPVVHWLAHRLQDDESLTVFAESAQTGYLFDGLSGPEGLGTWLWSGRVLVNTHVGEWRRLTDAEAIGVAQGVMPW